MNEMVEETKLISIAKKYGTPLYLYDGDLIIQRYNELFKFIKWPKLKIFYAMKANYNPDILKLLAKEGSGIDAVSFGDVIMALKCGFSPDKINYTANNITDEEMHMIKEKNVLINIGSLSRLKKYGKAYPNTEICLRFNPDVIAGAFKKIQTGGNLSKFGILLEDVEEVKKICKENNLKIVGLHEHTGSGIAETEKVYESMKNLLKIARKENFPDLRFVDFGGGFKVPYRPNEKRIDYKIFGKELVRIFKNYCEEYGKELELYFEPGKFLVAESGHLLVEVNTLKNNKGKLIAGINSGFPQQIRPTYYGAYHIIKNLSNPDGEIKEYDVVGNICEGGDIFASEREMPEISEGDFLDIENSGAYCYSMGGVYNLRPMPAEVIIIKGEDKISRKRLSFEELTEQIMGELE
jgi:diaminopimelate decarboxylase